MRNGEPGPASPSRTGPGSAPYGRIAGSGSAADAVGAVIMTEVSPFHCLYSDALDFHTQSRMMVGKSVPSASRLARAALMLYVGAAKALVHQAAVELARPDLAEIIGDPTRPMPLADAWRLLPAIVGPGNLAGDPATPPWPQFIELLALEASWTYPGPPSERCAYYRAPYPGADFEPLQPHQVTPSLAVKAEYLQFPRTGLPRDPYALRPHHLDTVRQVLDAAIESLDRKLEGALTRDNRHRRERVRVIHPPPDGDGRSH